MFVVGAYAAFNDVQETKLSNSDSPALHAAADTPYTLLEETCTAGFTSTTSVHCL